MKALVIDDSRLARNELKRLLEEHDHVVVIGEAGAGRILLFHDRLCGDCGRGVPAGAEFFPVGGGLEQ